MQKEEKVSKEEFCKLMFGELRKRKQAEARREKIIDNYVCNKKHELKGQAPIKKKERRLQMRRLRDITASLKPLKHGIDPTKGGIKTYAPFLKVGGSEIVKYGGGYIAITCRRCGNWWDVGTDAEVPGVGYICPKCRKIN